MSTIGNQWLATQWCHSIKASRSGNSKLMYYVTFGGIVMATTTHIRWYVIAKPVDPSRVLVSRGKLIRVGTNKKRGLVLIVINVWGCKVVRLILICSFPLPLNWFQLPEVTIYTQIFVQHMVMNVPSVFLDCLTAAAVTPSRERCFFIFLPTIYNLSLITSVELVCILWV